MMENEFERRLKTVDKSLLTAFVRHALGNETIELLDWQFQAIRGGFAQETVGGQGVYRLSGRAQTQNETLFWSLILKVLGASPGIGSDNTADWNYWKREVLAYQSGLLDHLPGNFCAPRCFGVIEYPGDEFWIWLEDIAEAVGSEWPLEHYGVVGRHLGQFNGAYLVGGSVPEKPWFTRGRVRNWLELGEPVLQDLGSLAQHPLARRWLTEESLERIHWLWVEREKFLEALDRLPRSLCHHDAFRRNLLGPA